MAIVLHASAELAKVNGVKCLVYSRSGMGKTVLLSTAPSPVIISAESGLLSLNPDNIRRIHGVDTPGINYNMATIKIRTIQELMDVEVWARTSPEARQFATIGIDSITEIAEVVLANAKIQVKDPRQAYGELLTQMQKTVKAFRDMEGKHVYMTSKEERGKDESTGMIMSGPAMPGSKFGPEMPYLFDEVFHLGKAVDPKTQLEYRYLRTQPNLTHEAKDRSGALDEIEAPNLGYIFNKILGQA